MNTLQPVNLQPLPHDVQLGALIEALDSLHTAASDGMLHTVTPLSHAEVIGALREMVYTAEQTILEIEQRRAEQPGLHLVRKTS